MIIITVVIINERIFNSRCSSSGNCNRGVESDICFSSLKMNAVKQQLSERLNEKSNLNDGLISPMSLVVSARTCQK